MHFFQARPKGGGGGGAVGCGGCDRTPLLEVKTNLFIFLLVIEVGDV